jgi:hypothetical protein
MAWLAKVLSFAGLDLTVEPAARYSLTVLRADSSGVDAPPLENDTSITVPLPEAGRRVNIGFVDTIEREALAGERRTYSRDPGTGEIAGDLWLKNDGALVHTNAKGTMEHYANGGGKISHENGSIELRADGTIQLGVVLISPDGVITGVKGLYGTGGAVDLITHVHFVSSTPGGSGGPI